MTSKGLHVSIDWQRLKPDFLKEADHLKDETDMPSSIRLAIKKNEMDSIEIGLRSQIVEFKKKKDIVKKKQWFGVDGAPYDRIEDAALSHYIALGLEGVHDEGHYVNQSMRAGMMCHYKTKKEFVALKIYSTPEDLKTRQFDVRNSFAQGLLQTAKDGTKPFLRITQAELIENMRKATKDAIYEFLVDDVINGRFHASPAWSGADFRRYRSFLDAVDVNWFADVATQQVKTGTYAGFPDLTLWDGSGLRFVEVKGPGDRFRPYQVSTHRDIFRPTNTDFSVALIHELVGQT
jgi:hypothetical protein